MDNLILFLDEQWLLVSAILALIAVLFFHESRKGGAQVGAIQLANMVNHHNALVVDLRDESEFTKGHIAGAINMPYASIRTNNDALNAHKTRTLIMVCKMGQFSASIAKQLRSGGYTQVLRLRGGIAEWRRQQMPLVTAAKKTKKTKRKALTVQAL